jgi:hypothetical protein
VGSRLDLEGGRRIIPEALKAWYLLCFRDISPKLNLQVWVRFLYRFWGRFGVPLGSFWEALGDLGGHFGLTWAALGAFGGPLG